MNIVHGWCNIIHRRHHFIHRINNIVHPGLHFLSPRRTAAGTAVLPAFNRPRLFHFGPKNARRIRIIPVLCR